jgi:aryl-alcohol dehydrogenase-like predicted oxidoreductase
MDYVKLGNSDLRVSRICLGCMGFGDPTIGQSSVTYFTKDIKPELEYSSYLCHK